MPTVIDVSSWQGALGWAAVGSALRSGTLAGVILRAGVGTTDGAKLDTRYRANMAAARALGAPRASYLFARPDLARGAVQGAALAALAGPLQPGEGLVLDLEAAPVTVPWAVEFARAVIDAAGVVPILYLGAANLNSRAYDWRPLRDLGCPLWVAAYGVNDGRPGRAPNPGPWTSWSLWQYTSTAAMAGVTPGNLDASLLAPGLTLDRLGYQPTKELPTVILPTATEVERYIERAYALRANTDDHGQMYWLREACKSDNPWAMLEEMDSELGPATIHTNPTA